MDLEPKVETLDISILIQAAIGELLSQREDGSHFIDMMKDSDALDRLAEIALDPELAILAIALMIAHAGTWFSLMCDLTDTDPSEYLFDAGVDAINTFSQATDQ